MFQEKVPLIFKVVVIGDSNVGKTCLTVRLCDGIFKQESLTTVFFDYKSKVFQIDGEQIELQLWDTAGQERFHSPFVAHFYRNIHAAVFVYDVTQKSSFEHIQSWLEEFQRNTVSHSTIPQIIIGNKCDLREERMVDSSDAKTLEESLGIKLWETSAKSEQELENLHHIFESLARNLKMKNTQDERQQTLPVATLHQPIHLQASSLRTVLNSSKKNNLCC